MKIYRDIEQGSEDWHTLRLCKVTASRVKDVLSKGRGGAVSKTAESYMAELIREALTGTKKDFFENDAMKWGTETEPQARAMYEVINNLQVEEVAFCELNGYVGISPDGLVGDDGLLEIKCPATETQIKRAIAKEFNGKDYSSDYHAQIQMQLWVTGRKWCDFLSFDPRLDVEAQYLCERVERDEEFISNMEEMVSKFVEDLKLKVAFFMRTEV